MHSLRVGAEVLGCTDAQKSCGGAVSEAEQVKCCAETPNAEDVGSESRKACLVGHFLKSKRASADSTPTTSGTGILSESCSSEEASSETEFRQPSGGCVAAEGEDDRRSLRQKGSSPCGLSETGFFDSDSQPTGVDSADAVSPFFALAPLASDGRSLDFAFLLARRVLSAYAASSKWWAGDAPGIREKREAELHF